MTSLLRIAARIAARSVPKGFDMSVLRRQKTTVAVFQYAKDHLDMVGCGSSRCAFRHSPGLVLKVARPRPVGNVREDSGDAVGMEANRAEVDVFTHPDTKPVVAAIRDFDPGYKWLLSEEVSGFTDSSQFEDATGYGLERFARAMVDFYEGAISRSEVYDEFDGELVRGVVGLIRNGMDPGDLTKPEHWGTAPDGRLVILDYGWDQEVTRHYESDGEAQAAE